MILITQQFDSYQVAVNKMQQADSDRFAENVRVLNFTTNDCEGGPSLNCYTLSITNLGIGTQIARFYINSTQSPGCTTPCILDPATDATSLRFRAADRHINPGESRNITMWLPSSIELPTWCFIRGTNSTYGCNSVTFVTTRGRVFSFQWPFPPLGPPAGFIAGGQGGTGIYIGPLVITFQKVLIAYTTNSSGKIQTPIGGTNGWWAIPPPPLVIYIKIQTDVGTPNDVYLTAQSVFELAQFNSPGNVFSFFVIAPITLDLCSKFAANDPEIMCDPAYGYYSGGNAGSPNNIVAYQSCNQPPASYNSANCPQQRYLIPRPTPEQLLNNQRGNPVLVAFSAKTASGSQPQPGTGGFSPGTSATSFLGLTYVYNDGTGGYIYAVTLPFIAVCINNPPGNPSMCPG